MMQKPKDEGFVIALRHAVEESLAFSATSNAVFLAEMLVREVPTEESKNLLAVAYNANGEIHRACACLRNAQSTKNRYYLALCNFKLGKLQEAENALTVGGLCGEGTPCEAYTYQLLAQICRTSSRTTQAIEHYMRALALNPALWCCYEGLCKLGADQDPLTVFTEKSMLAANGISKWNSEWPMRACGMPMEREGGTGDASVGARSDSSLLGMHSLAGALGACVQDDSSSSSRSAGKSGASTGAFGTRTRSSMEGNSNNSNKVPKLMFRNQEAVGDSGPPRRSPRLQAHSPGSVREARREQERDEGRDDDAENRRTKKQVLRRFAEGYRHLQQYRGKEAIAAFEKLITPEHNCAWVQVHMAIAYFNMAQYLQAEEAFKKARKLEPSRIEGMEIYSTVLWFLKKEHELCYLAQELVALDRSAPQTWCVLGNCFSVQREFETAIKFFNRAVQVCPSFTYAYTLAGHEHVSNEDFEKATASFRNSLRTDERHYNAWYGLAIIYLKQEKYQLAEYHLRRALAINPRNSVLHCYLGIVLLSSGSCAEALTVLQDAINLDPLNPLAKLRKAMALSSLGRNQEAFEELQQLQQLAPRESMVYIQMGKVLKKLGKLREALSCFNHAMDLDPKGGNRIKIQIDRLQIQDTEEDESFL